MTYPKSITVFGATGFVGRHLIRRLAKTGATIHVPTHSIEKALLLKPMGDVAQIVPFRCSTRSDASVAAAIGKSEAVINLIGILFEKGRNTFQSVHVETAARIARLAREEGAKRFVHMSALGVEQSLSAYGRTKVAGEQAIKTFFPDAAIIRPSVIFGPEDQLFNKFATMSRYSPALPLIGGGYTKFQPVYVGDVAEAITNILAIRSPSAVYELGGPQVYTFRQLLELTMATVGRHRCLVNLPWTIATLQASILQILPVPPLTTDQVKSLRTDNILTGMQDKTLADLGITPTALEMILPTYLR